MNDYAIDSDSRKAREGEPPTVGLSIVQALNMLEILDEAADTLEHLNTLDRGQDGDRIIEDTARIDEARGELRDLLADSLPGGCECPGDCGRCPPTGSAYCEAEPKNWAVIGEDRDGEGDVAALCALCAKGPQE